MIYVLKLWQLRFHSQPARRAKKVDSLREISQRVGLEINQEKTKVLRTNNRQEALVTIEGAAVEDVSEFVYVGSKSAKQGAQMKTSQPG